MRVYEKNGRRLNYQITYKPIKHVYFRATQDYIQVNASRAFNESFVLSLIDQKFDKLYGFMHHQSKTETHRYMLWGKILEKDEFYQKYQFKQTQKHYEDILRLETRQMVKSLEPILVEDLKKIGLTLVPMKVKKLKSRYGSCHVVRREITINIFMARLPEIYLYYVLLHEYAHLIVANHSKAFYAVLDQLMINHKEIQKSLRKHMISF